MTKGIPLLQLFSSSNDLTVQIYRMLDMWWGGGGGGKDGTDVFTKLKWRGLIRNEYFSHTSLKHLCSCSVICIWNRLFRSAAFPSVIYAHNPLIQPQAQPVPRMWTPGTLRLLSMIISVKWQTVSWWKVGTNWMEATLKRPQFRYVILSVLPLHEGWWLFTEWECFTLE